MFVNVERVSSSRKVIYLSILSVAVASIVDIVASYTPFSSTLRLLIPPQSMWRSDENPTD